MHNERLNNLVDEILDRCREQDIDVISVVDRLQFILLPQPETSHEYETEFQDDSENDEFGIMDFMKMNEDIIEEIYNDPNGEKMFCQVNDCMQRARDAIKYVCYEENCPKRVVDNPNIEVNFIEIWDEENAPIMENLDDISASILSDIYPGTY